MFAQSRIKLDFFGKMHFLAQFTALYRVVGLKKDMIKFSVTTYLRNATRSFLDGLIAGVFRSLSLILEK